MRTARLSATIPLNGVGDEVFAKHGDSHGLSHRLEVGERAAESSTLGEDTDRARPARFVCHREGCRIGDRRELAAGRTRALDLRDHVHGVARRERLNSVESGLACECSSFYFAEAEQRSSLRCVRKRTGY